MKLSTTTLILLLGTLPSPASGPGEGSATNDLRFHIHQWTTEHGLPDNGVRAIAQTPDGYLWLGTLNGLARFDGASFTTYTRGNTPGLVSDAINALAVDATGTLWVATADGLVEWRGGLVKRWTRPEVMGRSGRMEVFQLIAQPTGGLWWRDTGECGRLRDGVGTTFGSQHGLATNRAWSIVPARDGGLIALTHLGVQRLDVKKEYLGPLVPWPQGGADWQGVEDAADGLWLSANTGRFRLDANGWTSLPASNGFGYQAKFLDDGSGRTWMFSSDAELRQLQPDGTPGPAVLKPEERSVSTVFADREGNLWVGTGEGLYRLRPQRIRSWTTRDGLPSNKVRSVCAGPDGSVWAGTEGGLARIRAGTVELFPQAEPYTPHGLNPVWADRSGAVWGFKFSLGLLRFQGGRFERTPVIAEAPGYFVNSLYEDRAGRLCVGIDRGVSVWNEGRFERLFPSNVVNHFVWAMLEDRVGRWWLGTKDGGLKRFEGGRATTFTTTNGLSDNKVTCFHEDADGAIWIGTENGLNRFKDGRLAVFRTGEGLPENVVYHILEDDAGNLWWSGLRGIHRARRAQLDAVADRRTNHVQCLTYGEADGMASSETNGELQPAGCKTPDGHLWFPTIKGVVEIDPRQLIESEVAPPVVIEQVKANGQVVFGDEFRVAGSGFRVAAGGELTNAKPETRNLKIGPGQGRVLEIHFTANSLSAPEKVRFKYKLEPGDHEWHDAKGQRFAFLQNLRPGRYTFHIQACNHRGLWNEAGASFAFVIAPQFHETAVFYALCGGALLAVVGSMQAVRLSAQRRVLRAEHQRSLEEERTRLARDLHDELGTALTGLALEIDVARRDLDAARAGSGRLREMADSARAMAARMREVVWTISPRCDNVPGLATFLEQHALPFARAAGLQCQLKFPMELPALPLSSEVRHQIALGVREALTNVVRHARATQVVLGLKLEDQKLVVQVTDDGTGFDAAQWNGGHGLGNLRSRLETLGGTLTCESKPGRGTTLTLHVPLAGALRNGPA